MQKEIPKIEALTIEGPLTLRLRWDGKRAADVVNLSGWIATGGERLAPLKDLRLFHKAHIASYGRAVAWDDDDLAIDSLHLKMLADEQRSFGNDDLKAWQARVQLSNAEAAVLVNVSLSTWNSYRTTATIPAAVAAVH